VKNCDQFQEMFEAYTLGALDASERAPLEAHLASGCKDCAKAVAEARWLVSQLAYLAPQAAPSDMLKGRLIQTVRAEAHLATKQSASLKPAIPFWMWTGVAALLFFSLYSAWNARQLEQQIRKMNQYAVAELQRRSQLEKDLFAARSQALILTDPASVNIVLSSADRQVAPLQAKWHAQFGIVLTGQNVPMPSGGRVLQLWLIPKTPSAKPVPSLTIRPYVNGKLILLVSQPPEILANTKALAITEEPLGGSAQPTPPIRWVGGVS